MEAPVAAAEHVRASPLARRLAEERGIDLARVNGSGPGGRITRDDVLAFDSQATEAAPASPAAEAIPASVAADGPDVEIMQLSRMRQTIARRTVQSMQEAPHFYVTADVDMTLALTLRQQLNEKLAGETRVSINDMIIKACALALVKYPAFNSSFQGDHLRVYKQVNVGIAVALEQGLLVLSLGDCRDKSLADISKTSREVVERAQAGVLREEGLYRGYLQHQQHGNVRCRRLLGDHLPAAGRGPGSGHGAQAAGGAGRPDYHCPSDEGHSLHRPPRRRRCAGRRVCSGGQATAGEPRQPAGVRGWPKNLLAPLRLGCTGWSRECDAQSPRVVHRDRDRSSRRAVVLAWCNSVRPMY